MVVLELELDVASIGCVIQVFSTLVLKSDAAESLSERRARINHRLKKITEIVEKWFDVFMLKQLLWDS